MTGESVSSPAITLGSPTVGEEEIDAVREVMATGWLSGAGPTCAKFEDQLATLCSVSHALATSSCGSALHLGLLAFGAGRGDEVIVGDYTFPATGHSVTWVGATPIFADVRPDIWSVDPAAVEAAITERTVGIIAVDPFGQPADYDELRAIADKRGLWLMEDAACATGATYKGRAAGSLADIATFSFHGRKGITAGEGGALLTSDAALADRARLMHTYGTTPAAARAPTDGLATPTFDDIGYNYRLSDVAAGIMLAQLNRLPDLLARRRAIATLYRDLLAGTDGLATPIALPDREHPWQSYVLTLDPGIDRDHVAMALRSAGIQCNIGTYASHLLPVYGEQSTLPVSADIFHRHLAIPMHANLTDADVARVVDALQHNLKPS